MYSKIFAEWRFELKLYPSLVIYRQIVTKMYNFVWWELVQMYPKCKKPCITMTKLVCGRNRLAINTQHEKEYEARICKYCTNNVVEDLMHFVLKCPIYDDIRNSLFCTIMCELSYEGSMIFNRLKDQTKLLLLLGLEYPLLIEDKFILRYISSVHINQMYKKRCSLD